MILTFSWRYHEKPRQRHTIAYLSVDVLRYRQLLTCLVSLMIAFIQLDCYSVMAREHDGYISDILSH